MKGRRKKYEDPPPLASDADTVVRQLLDRDGLDVIVHQLVRQCGRDAVCDAIPTRPANRPGNRYQVFELMNYADTVEDWAADYRDQGKPNFLQLALLDALEMEGLSVKAFDSRARRHRRGKKLLREYKRRLALHWFPQRQDTFRERTKLVRELKTRRVGIN